MTYFTTANAVRGGLLAAAALLVASATPALATQVAPPGNWLYLTVTQSEARAGDAPGKLLLCNPPRGHARAAEACAELTAAGGDIGGIPQKDAFCTMIYAPVTATARGEWNGRPVQYTKTFSNPCAMAASTGSVFGRQD
ncbi:SSI family serine proteinase inhibitor [Streptomyces sp. NPDC051954]|uniref:SSI family serine proteinase inhibitor n=1 Tax=Streptomyces sp. NPDC051954 TaxID=3155524 RepID=UPI00343C84C7